MATVTLKNIPDDLYDRLKRAAKAHHRSVNGELINCLEVMYEPVKLSPRERLARVRRVRPSIAADAVGPDELQQAIDSGRP